MEMEAAPLVVTEAETLPAIVEARPKLKLKHPRAPKFWNPELDARFVKLWEAGTGCTEIASTLGTTMGSVTSRRAKLGLDPRQRRGGNRKRSQGSVLDAKFLEMKFSRPKLKLKTKPKPKTKQLTKPLTKPKACPHCGEELGAPKAAQPKLVAPTPEALPAPPQEAPPKLPPVPVGGLPLWEAEPNQCRWPINPENEPYRCCAAPVVELYSYCASHCLRAFHFPRGTTLPKVLQKQVQQEQELCAT